MNVVIDRQIVLYIHNVDMENALYASDTLYPNDDLQPKSDMVIIDGGDYSVVGGSVTLSEMICEGELNFGSPIANMFECEIYGLENITLANNKIEVYVRDNQVQKPLFSGYIDSCKEGRLDKTKRIVAYDALHYKADIDVADWWTNFWTNRRSCTLKQLRESLLVFADIEYDTEATLINDSMTITKYSGLSAISFQDMLKMICELSFVFPNINRSGVLEFVTLDTSSYIDLDTNADGSVNYEGSNASWEDYTTNEITGIKVYSDESTLNQTVGEDYNCYAISGNFLILDKKAQDITTLCENLLDSVEGITYVPCEIPLILSSFDYTVGKKFKTEKGYSFIMASYYSGVQLVNQTLECFADGPLLAQTAKSYNREIIFGRKMSKIEQDIDGITTTVREVVEEVDQAVEDAQEALDEVGQYDTRITTVESSITQHANEIVMKVDSNGRIVQAALTVDPDEGTEFKVSADNISFIANDVMDLAANRLGISSTNFSINKDTGNVEVKGDVHATTLIADESISIHTEGTYQGEPFEAEWPVIKVRAGATSATQTIALYMVNLAGQSSSPQIYYDPSTALHIDATTTFAGDVLFGGDIQNRGTWISLNTGDITCKRYVNAKYFNTSCADQNPASYTSSVAFIDSNGYLRKSSKANFVSWLGKVSSATSADKATYASLNYLGYTSSSTAKNFTIGVNTTEIVIVGSFTADGITKLFSGVIPKNLIGSTAKEIWLSAGSGGTTASQVRCLCNVTLVNSTTITVKGTAANNGSTNVLSATSYYVYHR